MFKNDNGNFKEGIVWWDQEKDLNADVDIFFYIHDYDGRAKHKYGFKTLHIDLRKSIEETESDFKSNLRNELRRAEEMGFTIEVNKEIDKDLIKEYVDTYNSFAAFKKLQLTTEDLITEMVGSGKFEVSRILKDGTPIAWHSHYIGEDHPRLYQSFSTLNDLTPKENGLANKFLTYKDILRYKDNGFAKYDFGGIGNVEGDNKKFEGIIRFKKAFGGEEVILWKGVTPNGERGEAIYKKYWLGE